MIRNSQKFILVFLSVLSLAAAAHAQSPSVTAKLEQQAIRIGDQTRLRLSVMQAAGIKVGFPEIPDTLSGKVQVLSSSKADTLADRAHPGNLIISKTYTLTCFDAGTYVLPAFRFNASGTAMQTAALTLDVQTVKVDTTKAIYDIKQPLAVSYTWTDWLKDNWYLVVLPLAGLALLFLLVRYLRKRPKPLPAAAPPVPSLPVHTLALNRLDELRSRQLWQQGQVKAYYSELSDVIREYLEKRFRIQAQEKTTAEMITALHSREISTADRQLLESLLRLADLVKFAKEQPQAQDNEQSLAQAVSFVLHTQQAPPTISKQGGDSSEPI